MVDSIQCGIYNHFIIEHRVVFDNYNIVLPSQKKLLIAEFCLKKLLLQADGSRMNDPFRSVLAQPNKKTGLPEMTLLGLFQFEKFAT
jgi:hypothetical protein